MNPFFFLLLLVVLTEKVLQFGDHGMKCREELVAQSELFNDLCHLQRPKLLLYLKEKLTVLLGGEVLHTRQDLTVRTGWI